MDPHYGFALNSRFVFWENHGLQNLSILTKLPQFLTRVYSTMLLEHTHTHTHVRPFSTLYARVMIERYVDSVWTVLLILRVHNTPSSPRRWNIKSAPLSRFVNIGEEKNNLDSRKRICPIKKLYTRIYIWRTECIIINRNGEESGAGRRITAGKKTFGNNGFIVAIGRAESPWTEGAVKDETRTFIGNFTWWNNEWNIANASQWYAARSVAGIVQRKKKGGRDGAPPPHCHCFLKGSDVKPCGEGR